jgi:uroporphyrinogen-III decarboxylase
MNSRERLLTVLEGKIPDRVPVAPFVQDEYLSYYYPEKNHVDRVIDAVELARELDFDLIAKHRKFETAHFLKKSYPNWELSRSVSRENGMQVTKTTITTPARVFEQEVVTPESGAATSGVHATIRKHLLSSAEDIEVFMEYLPSLDDETIKDMHDTAREWRKLMGDDGILAPWGWAGVFNAAADLRGIENIMMDPYMDADMYCEFMDHLTKLQCNYNEQLAQTEVECVGIQGHMANSGTVSAEYYGSYVLPYEKKLVSAIHAAGKKTVFHNCGPASTLYPSYRELGMTVWETVSAKPQGDNDLATAKAELGDTVCLLGNLDQINFLKQARPEEVDAATRKIVSVGKPGGRYVFSTSDFLEKDTPVENVKAMIKAAREEGVYS